MADTLKQFSNLTGKTLSELNAGVTLVSTTGSEKAVIKSISIENEKARKVDIRLGSSTGTKIADGSKTGTLGGNEILDNSQSLVAVTSSELVLTDIIVAGWAEGNSSESTFNEARTNDDGLYKYPHSSVSSEPIFSPDEWRGYLNEVDPGSIDFPKSSDNNASGRAWGESFEDKFGNMWIFNTAELKTFKINNVNKSDKILYKQMNDADNNAVTNLKQFGGCRAACYDGERYIYVFDNGNNYLKKYDTHTNATTDTFTQVSLYNCSTGDTDALTIDMSEREGVCYYRDGYIVWQGGNQSNGVGRRFNITEVATGKTKMLYDERYTRARNDGIGNGNISNSNQDNNQRRTIGFTKATNGDYFAWIANWSDNSQSTGYNFWSVTNLGNDPKTTYIPNSVGTSAEASAKKTYEIDMWSVMGTPGGGDNNHYAMCYRLAGAYGKLFDAPRGFTWHTPGIDRYSYVGSDRFSSSDSGSGGMSSNYNSYRLDFDQIDNQVKDKFCTRLNHNMHHGSVHVRKDVNQASSAFGTVSIRTTGILVT